MYLWVYSDIYLQYQPNEYFTQYLCNNKLRPDSRGLSDHRPLRISISNRGCSVTVSRGSTIIITQLSTTIQKVIHSPVSNSYGRQLLTLTINSVSNQNTAKWAKLDRNSNKAIENYVEQFVDWPHIEKQLVYAKDDGELYAHVGDIGVRVVDADGCVQETVLVAVGVLLWTAQFWNIRDWLENKGNGQCSTFMINPKSFYFPIKYCQILNQLLCDPTETQQKNSQYELTLITDLKPQPQKSTTTTTTTTSTIPCTQFLKSHKSSNLSPQLIEAVQKLHNVILSKLGFDIEELRKKCQGGDGSQRQVVNIVGL